MRIGCIFTAKNEEELIAANINYHRFMGVTDFFVFLDHSTDGTKNLLQGTPNVHIFENLSYQDLLPYNRNKPNLDLALVSEKFAAHNGVRQVLHGNMALQLCLREQIDWLIHLDPDELICLNPHQVQKDSLKDLFSGLEARIGAVIFRNLEVATTLVEPAFVFEDRLFKNCHLTNDDMVGLPKTEVTNPYSGEKIPAGWYWGHSSGKLGARVLPQAYFTILTHLFQTPGEIITRDYLLHYNILSYRHFVNKYRNFRDFPKMTSLGRPVKALRTLLVEMVNDPAMTDTALESFYREQIAYSAEEIELIQQKHPTAFSEIWSVADFMRQGK